MELSDAASFHKPNSLFPRIVPIQIPDSLECLEFVELKGVIALLSWPASRRISCFAPKLIPAEMNRSTLLAALLLTGSAFAQNARDAVMLDTTPLTPSHGAVVDCRDELTAIAFVEEDTLGDEIWVAMSDDRGIDWSTAVRIDQDSTGSNKETQGDAIYVFGDAIYVAWSDERHGNVEVYMNHSNDGGLTWQGEQLIEKGYGPGVGTVDQWAMRVSPRASNTFNRVYFVFATTRPGTTDESLYFSVSEDGAVTWGGPTHVPAGMAQGTGDVENVCIDIRRKEPDLFISWQDNRLNSVDGTANGDLDISIAGPWYLVGWQDDRAGAGTFEFRVNHSDNYGIDWLAQDEMLGNYVPGVDNVSEIDVLLNRQIYTASWIDDRTGTPEAYAVGNDTFSTNGWVEFQMSSGGAQHINLDGHHDHCGTSWRNLTTGQYMGNHSFDQGVSWAAPQVEVSTTIGATGARNGGISYNKNHSNFIMGWEADDSGVMNVYAGGYRPHTLIPVGPLTKGSQLSFEIEHYPLTNATYEFGVLFSAAPGAWRLPDRRFSGLHYDNYLQYSFGTLNTFKGIVSMTGTGSTGSLTIPTTIPDFTTLYLVAVGAGAVRDGRGALTDVMSITILP